MNQYDAMEVQATNAKAQASASSDTLGKFALLTILLVTIMLIGGMIADKQKVTMAFICGVGFFTVFGGMVIFILSGQMAAMIINHQNQRTVRMFNTMQFQLYAKDAPRIVEKNVETPMLEDVRPSLPGFIPAVPLVSDQLKLSCYDFIVGLFGEDGAPNPEKILGEDSKRPGQIQAKKPRPEVVEYLLGLGIVTVEPKTNMLFFKVKEYPTLRECQQAIRHNTPGGGYV